MTRPKRPSRDELGLLLAHAWALRGTCGRRRVGCVLFDAQGYQIGAGYNGPAHGVSNCSAATPCPGFGAPSGTALDLCDAVHAEINALTRCDRPRDIYTCYVTTSPCESCVKALMNTSCERIIFSEDYVSAHVELSADRWRRLGRLWLRLDFDPFLTLARIEEV